jgi:hypothetical protein
MPGIRRNLPAIDEQKAQAAAVAKTLGLKTAQ